MANESWEPLPWDIKALMEANIDLDQRIASEGMELFYEPEEDTLFVTIGQDTGAITEPLIDTIYIRIDPDTNLIMGYTLLNFKSHLLKNNSILRKAFEPTYTELVSKGGRSVIQDLDTTRARMLISALRMVA
jgi:hypothetical protein